MGSIGKEVIFYGRESGRTKMAGALGKVKT